MGGGGATAATRLRGALPLGVALALAWPVWLHRLGINDYDDGVSNEVLFARGPLARILFDLRWDDQSPLYFLLLHVWTLLGRDPFTVKLLNVLWLSLALWLLWRIARLSGSSPRVAVLALCIAALSPLSLWLARNGRMYVPQIALTLFSLDALLRVLRGGGGRAAAGLVIACALNIYTHFFGFLISGLVLGAWLLEAVLAARPGGGARAATRGPLLAGAALALLVAPQLVRALALGDRPPPQAAWSLPGASVASLEQVQAFWFVNASWSGLRHTLPFVDELFYVCAYGLAILGVAASPPPVARLTLLWFAAPLALFGALAGTLDLRARYLSFVAPLLWLAIARGALGSTPGPARLGRPLRIARIGMLAVFASCSLWLLWHKLPERYAEWTKVLGTLDRVYRSGAAVYMQGGAARGIPPAVVAHAGLHPELAAPARVSPESREAFRRELREGREFAFLVHRGRIDDEQAWMHRSLEDAGYARTRLPGWNAEALLFTPEPPQRFALRYRVAEPELPDWIAARLADPHRVPDPDSALATALVARIGRGGGLRESVVYASQRGERGAWHLGDAGGSAVSDTRVRLGGELRPAWRVRVPPGEVALLALPRGVAGDPRVWRWGVMARDAGGGGELRVRLQVGARTLARLRGPAEPAWNPLPVAADALDEADGPLSLWLSHPGDDERRVYLALEASAGATRGGSR